jgi:hypothetical protein
MGVTYGAFTPQTAAQIDQNIVAATTLNAAVWYVDTVNGLDTNDGQSATSAFQTMRQAFSVIDSNDQIRFVGKVREQLVAPLGVYGVTIIGAAGAGAPRTDLAASWLAPSSPTATTPLLQLREQGWSLQNFLMTGPSDDACVKLSRRENATYPDASHATFYGMQFQGGFIHIEDDGGSFNVRVNGCTFMLASGVGGGAIVSTSTTIAAPYKWVITNSVFQSNVNHIVMPYNKAIIGYNGNGNVFAAATTAVINLTGGTAPNIVCDNTFDIAAASFDPAGGLTFAFVANQQDYTIGPNAADLTVTSRPVTIDAANVILQSPSPVVRNPITIHTSYQWWASISVRDVTTTFPTDLYYETDFPNGTLKFWPVPTTTYGFELFVRNTLSLVTLNSTLNYPPGYQDAITLTLAEYLAPSYGIPPSDIGMVAKRGGEARARIFANNQMIPALRTQDAGMPSQTRGRCNFNYRTGLNMPQR